VVLTNKTNQFKLNIMGYKWKPNKAQARAFAERMKNDHEFANARRERLAKKAERNRASSEFDYYTAGGEYKPTENQRSEALKFLGQDLTEQQKNACEMIVNCYDMGVKTHHDNIHIVNELSRNEK
tara:strand:- start:68 stop:442 length:375 start_codon:yes stop_codon:yes gene_type:complete